MSLRRFSKRNSLTFSALVATTHELSSSHRAAIPIILPCAGVQSLEQSLATKPVSQIGEATKAPRFREFRLAPIGRLRQVHFVVKRKVDVGIEAHGQRGLPRGVRYERAVENGLTTEPAEVRRSFCIPTKQEEFVLRHVMGARHPAYRQGEPVTLRPTTRVDVCKGEIFRISLGEKWMHESMVIAARFGKVRDAMTAII
jgi:hypothetical protein